MIEESDLRDEKNKNKSEREGEKRLQRMQGRRESKQAGRARTATADLGGITLAFFFF